jgi:hypothetical protein
MRQGLDFNKAEAALKRAAKKAVGGTREERAGRFARAGKSDRNAAIGVERVRHTNTGKTDKWRKR